MTQPFHSGELAVQQQAGVSAIAHRVGRSIHGSIPPAAADFLAERSWVVAASADPGGRPWASLLSGAPGFITAMDDRTVRIRAWPAPDDPLARSLEPGALIGVLAPDLATRRRMRLNGRVGLAAAGTIQLHADQVYANCPQYIHPREVEPVTGRPRGLTSGQRAMLTEADRERIRGADTFFIATINPGEGADASHRGGAAGFIQVHGNRLTWPDFPGNRMFNTLGNIARLPRAGLLIPEWHSGSALQLTGRAEIDWDPGQAAAFPGAERLVHLEVEEVIETRGVAVVQQNGAP